MASDSSFDPMLLSLRQHDDASSRLSFDAPLDPTFTSSSGALAQPPAAVSRATSLSSSQPALPPPPNMYLQQQQFRGPGRPRKDSAAASGTSKP